MRSLSPGTTRANLARTSSVDESLLSSVFPFPVLRGRPRPRREQSGPRFLVASARSDLKNQICVITLRNVSFQGRLLYRFDGLHCSIEPIIFQKRVLELVNFWESLLEICCFDTKIR